MNTQPVSVTDPESTRKIGARIYSEFLQQLAAMTQDRAADCMGVSASTVSRMKTEAEPLFQLFAALGFQLAPLSAVVVSRDDMEALERMAYKYLQTKIESRRR